MHDLDLDEQYDKIYRYCYFRVYSRETAEDITQETFLRFLESGSYHSAGKALRYLYTIARNLCIDEYRRKGRQALDPVGEENCGEMGGYISAKTVSYRGNAGCGEPENGGEDGAEQSPGVGAGDRRPGARRRHIVDDMGSAAADGLEERMVTRLTLQAAMEGLETDAQEMVLLRYVNEVPVGVIGKIYGISRFAVYRKIRESLSLLRERLGEEDFT